MNYKNYISLAMENISKKDKSFFLGYNVKKGSKASGTLNNVPENKLLETPVAENLMVSMAIGLSLEGYIPIVYFERFDFIMNSMDAIVNHLDKIKKISYEEYTPKVLIRACVGRKESPFFTGLTHIQDFTEELKKFVSFPVIKLPESKDIISIYEESYYSSESSIIVEELDKYNVEI